MGNGKDCNKEVEANNAFTDFDEMMYECNGTGWGNAWSYLILAFALGWFRSKIYEVMVMVTRIGGNGME